jgi:threonine/homoserine/homoserine lactone efflux protein
VWRGWGRGFLTNLLNPKVGAFYVAVLPQFIPPGTSHVAVGVLLATVHAIESMLWFTAIIFGAGAVHLRRVPRCGCPPDHSAGSQR